MKIVIEHGYTDADFFLYVIQGNQKFQVGYPNGASKEECLWMRKMIRIALRNHDKEQKEKNERKARSRHSRSK